MANPIAGWYPDPSGDPSKLRWWDGTQWTNDFADAVAQPVQNPGVGQANQPYQAQQSGQFQQQAQAQPVPQPQMPYNQQAQPQQQQAQSIPQPQMPSNQQGQAYTPQYSQAPYAQQTTANSSDDTLRLVAFILCVISTVSVCWAIIPLAWMIPMTVHCWGIYKRQKPNTTAFGVCTLIFLNLIGGILLLVSTRER